MRYILKQSKKYIDTLRARLEKMLTDKRAFRKAKYIAPFFYYFVLFLGFLRLEGLQYARTKPEMFEPRFLVAWMQSFDFENAVTFIFLFFVVAVFTAALFPGSLLARVGAFLGILQYHAFLSSSGVHHQLDYILWIALIFILLPNVWKATPSDRTKKRFLATFLGAQAFILLTYTMAGITKVYGAITQTMAGTASAFSFDSGALHVADMMYRMQETTVLGPLIVEYLLIGWIPYMAIIYVQLVAVYILWRPSLHRMWGALLILFHVATFLTMRGFFPVPTFLLLMFFVSSPFYYPASWKTKLGELPLFGHIFKRIP